MEQLPKIVQHRLEATADVHPDANLLTAFAEKSLNERDRARMLQHLACCADCRSVILIVLPEIEVSPPTPSIRSALFAWPVLRWGAMAACAVVVTAAVTLHYDRRRSAESTAAQKTPARMPSANLAEETPNQPGEKLAAKTPSPSPFASDRDFAASGKLARQSKTDTSAVSSPAFDETGKRRRESPSAENGRLGTPQRPADQLADNKMAESDEFRADKPTAPPSGRRVAAAPSVVSSAVPATSATGAAMQDQAQSRVQSKVQSKTQSEAESKELKQNLDHAAQSAGAAITGQAKSGSSGELQAAEQKSKQELLKGGPRKGKSVGENIPDKNANANTLATTASSEQTVGSTTSTTAEIIAGGHENEPGLSKKTSAKTYFGTTPRWIISSGGEVQRSSDSGKTWETIAVDSNAAFRALAANDSDVWVGGSRGTLYHSADDGRHWTQVRPLAQGKTLTADIISLEFMDSSHGKLVTSTRETWTTADGGVNWRRK